MTSQGRAQQSQHQAAAASVLDALDYHIAIAADIRSQVKQAHWSVVGPNFIAIHRLFDEQTAMLAAHIDLLAERMRALQAVPHGTLREAANNSDIPELPIRELFEEDAIAAILERFETYSERVGDAIDACDKASDLTTQDLFIGIRQQLDLQAYFLRSHLPGPGAAERLPHPVRAAHDARTPDDGQGGNGA